MKNLLLAGNMPYLAVGILVAGAFYLGHLLSTSPTRIAVAEKGAVVLEAVLARAGENQETLEKEVSQPLVALLNHYAAMGFAVIDISKDEAGNMTVAALPKDVLDITSLLRDAIKKPTSQAQTQAQTKAQP